MKYQILRQNILQLLMIIRKFRSEILETKIKETRLADKPSISNLLKKFI